MITKVCGLSRHESIKAVAALRPTMMGFIFYAPSPRNACALLPKVVDECVPPGIERVGVFVDAPAEHILKTASRYGLGTVQLHGRETPAVCAQLRREGLKVLKAFGLGGDMDWRVVLPYGESADMFVFDTLTACHGGSGRKFDWNVLRTYPMDIPYLLSGGIGPGDGPAVVQAAATLPHMAGVDVNSRFETAPGCKDAIAVGLFLKSLEH